MKKNAFQVRSLAVFSVCLFTFAAASNASELVTQRSPSIPAPSAGAGDSMNPIVSPDGRWVLFASSADNLVDPGTNTPPVAKVHPTLNVYLRNVTNGTTTLVSVDLNGNGGGNGDSVPVGISTNGQFALFESQASNLVTNDFNKSADVFVRDIIAGTTILVSANSNGVPANRESRNAVMTPDGRYVAFKSLANDIYSNDFFGAWDVFVRDIVAGVTTPLTANARNSQGRWTSEAPEISADGRYVAFFSTATNLAPGATSTTGEIYVSDLVAGTTQTASLGAHDVLPGGIVSYNHLISEDGQFVGFESTQLSGASTNAGVVFRYHLASGNLEVVATNALSVTQGFATFQSLDMSPDGRFIAYVAWPDPASTRSTSAVYLWDALSGTSTLVSGDLNGDVVTNAECSLPTIDASGRYVSFLSSATTLTTNTVAKDSHLFVRDVQTATTRLVDANPSGGVSSKSIMNVSGLSPDGRYIAFDCADSDLVANDGNGDYDVFLSDLETGTITLISARALALPSISPRGGLSYLPIASTESGRFIVFASLARDLADNDTNQWHDIYVRDTVTGTNTLVSVNTNGTAASGPSSQVAISQDGRYVAFRSEASDLVINDTNGLPDIFVRDLLTGTTVMTSTDITNGNLASSYYIGRCDLLAFSADGRYVLFSDNPSAGVTLLVHCDLQAGTNTVLTSNYNSRFGMSADGLTVAFSTNSGNRSVWVWHPQNGFQNFVGGVYVEALNAQGNRLVYYDTFFGQMVMRDLVVGTNILFGPETFSPPPQLRVGSRISADGRFYVYATLRQKASGDTNNFSDIYLFDYNSRSNRLISRGLNSDYAADALSDSPSISPDGRFIVYRSRAGNIVATITNHVWQRYLYDRETGVTTLVGVSTSGVQPNYRAMCPVFSGDSTTLFFRSFASDMFPFDFNEQADIFSWKLISSDQVTALVGQILFDPGLSPNPTITWPVLPGKTYEVQFKNDLSDPSWTPLAASITVVGERGYATDFAPEAEKRFYRIKAY